MSVEKNAGKARRRRGRKSGGHGRKPEVKQNDQDTKNGSVFQIPSKSTSLLIQLTEDAPTWYSCGRQIPGRDDTITSHPPATKGVIGSQVVSTFREQADELYKREVQNFGTLSTSSSDEQWVENTMRQGTLKDRIAAMSVIVSTNPVHKLYALDSLLQLAGNHNARVAQMAAEALEDLFISTLLPPNRKLLSLDQRPLHLYQDGTKTLSPRVVLLWRYEEMVKERFQLFRTKYLVHTLQGGLDMNKLSALRTASALLREVPEGEGPLLSMICNKLGDPSRKIAAAAGHELRRVLEQHANMQLVVAREVQQLAHRPHLSPRALYNCIIFLNQLQLSAEVPRKQTDTNRSTKAPKSLSLPASLIQTYFRLFEVAVDKSMANDGADSGIKSRLLSALLTGVNRAHPFLPEKDKDLEEHIDSLYRVVHSGPPSASTQALMLLFHVAVGSRQDGAPVEGAMEQTTARQDRFYRALYSTLSRPSIVARGKHVTIYFNLLYKAMKNDPNSTRVNAFAKRLLCTTMHTSSPVIAASLFLLSEIMKNRDELRSCFADSATGQNAMAVLDASKREPKAAFSIIDRGESQDVHAQLWESSLVYHHFHPSVAKFAAGDIEYLGDPLRDFALSPFLDKFAYRNPKTAKNRGESVAERRKITDTESRLPVNDPSFLEQDRVDEQDEFFHKFFLERSRRDEMKGIVRGRGKIDDEDEAFDIAENLNTDQTFEHRWETDSEEEAFVDSLAEKLIEDAAGTAADFDDEDPDMEGWDDMYLDKEPTASNNHDFDKRDAFMGAADGSSDEDDTGSHKESEQFDKEYGDRVDDDVFMDADDDSDSGSDEHHLNEKDFVNRVDSNEASESEDDFVLADSSESEPDEETKVPSKRMKKNGDPGTDVETFADASEYEEMIEKSWQELSQQRLAHFDQDVDSAVQATRVPEKPGGGANKKCRRRSKKKRAQEV